MAQSLQQLARRIKTAKNIAQVARAMEMISASKIKRAQNAVERNRPYAQKISSLATSILRHIDRTKISHPFIDGNKSPNTLLVIISPDKGLCGSLPTNLLRKLLQSDNKNLRILTLGKKAHGFSRKIQGETVASFELGTTLPDYSLVFKLIEVINNEFTHENASSVQVLWSSFQSIFSQVPTIKTVLPIEVPDVTTAVSIHSQPGSLALAGAGAQSAPYIFEPAAEVILADLLPYYLEVVLYNCIIEAFTSEQAARMIAMQNAKNNALDIADYLTLSYNKSRQERITNELLTLAK